MTVDTEIVPQAPQRRAEKPQHEIRPGTQEERFQVLSSALIVVFMVCGWMLLQLLVLGNISEQRSQNLLYQQFRHQAAQGIVPTGALDYKGQQVDPGSPVAIISIPKLGLNQVVVQGTSSGDLLNGPGHRRDTVMPGEVGVSQVFGRGATYGAPFRNITDLKPGDQIQVFNAATGDTNENPTPVIYSVTHVRRAGDVTESTALKGTQGQLTLVSSEGSGFLSALRPHSVVYVDAVTQKATPADPNVAFAVPSSENAWSRDTSVLPMLTLLLAFMAGLVLAISIARRHLRAVLVWLVATPIVVALAWGITDQVMHLLPNLM